MIWISFRYEGTRSFRLALPVPLLLFWGLSCILEDIACLIPRRYEKNGKALSPGDARQIVLACVELLRGLAFDTERMDLVDIDINDGEKRYVIKCLLR